MHENMINFKSCPVCDSETLAVKYHNHPGYQKPLTYDIIHCDTCDTSFASPLETNDKIYELIYSMSDKVPGYSRYSNFASSVLLQKNPLEYLAQQEDTYWGIKTYFDKVIDKTLKVLEVGSGLGYLTYSISKKGFNVKGIDISEKAVGRANGIYGNNYICADIITFSKSNKEKFDVIVLTEVIEHIPNIYEFIGALDNMLAIGGDILITTPNKSNNYRDTLWATDAPPVHLWWFSETSFHFIADKIGYLVRFVDFTEFNKKNNYKAYRNVYDKNKRLYQPIASSTFDAQGNILEKSKINNSYITLNKLIQYMRKVMKLSPLSLLSKLNLGRYPGRSGVLCAVLTKKDKTDI